MENHKNASNVQNNTNNKMLVNEDMFKKGDLKMPVLNYISYNDCIDSVVSKILKTHIKTLLSKDQYHGLLSSIFQGDLEKIPVNLERYILLSCVLIHGYCEICDLEISFFNSEETCIEGIHLHINGKKHKKRHEALGQHFTSMVNRFDVNDSILLPNDIFSRLFSSDILDHKKYFKVCLYLLFECKLCKHKFKEHNKIQPIQKAVYNHISEQSHVAKYVGTLKRSYKFVCAHNVIRSSIDNIFEEAKPFVSKELYLELLMKIYQNKLEMIPEGCEKHIVINLDLSLNCNLCMCEIFESNYSELESKVNQHIRDKKHSKKAKIFKSSDGDMSRFEKYSELVIDSDMIKIPKNFLDEIFTVNKFNPYSRKFIDGYLNFDVKCNVCDKAIGSSAYVSDLQMVIDSHIHTKKHMSIVLRRMSSSTLPIDQ